MKSDRRPPRTILVPSMLAVWLSGGAAWGQPAPPGKPAPSGPPPSAQPAPSSEKPADDALLAELEAAAAEDAAETAKSRGADATKAQNIEEEDPINWLPEGAREVIGNEANPAMSIILDFAGAVFAREERYRQGGHAPVENGPTIQGAELAASAAIDPFFRIDMAVGMAHLHLEEIYLTTTALPLNLQLRGGQFKSNIGRHNPTHLHEWHFVTHPVPNEFLFGAEGLTLPGVELSFLFPLPWYVELIGALQMGDSGSFRTPFDTGTVGFGDFIYPLRLVQFFDVNDDTAMQVGLNAVFGRSQNNPDLDNRTYAYGTDLLFKWRPIGWGETGYTYIAWITEAWVRQMEVADDIWDDIGGYSDIIVGIDKEWETAARIELWKRVHGLDENPEINRRDFGLDTVRPSAAVSYMPSHFSRVRMQYTFEHIEGFNTNHIGLIQLEVAAGAHGAHKY